MTVIPRAVLILGAALLALAACQSSDNGAGKPSEGEARRALVTFLTTAGTLGQEEVTFSRLAETKAADPDVRRFATSLIAEQRPLNDQLAAMAEHQQIPPPTEMDARHATLYRQLEARSGAPFDRAYLETQMQDRTMLIQAFQAQADAGTDPQVRGFATQHLPELMQSLQTAHSLAGNM